MYQRTLLSFLLFMTSPIYGDLRCYSYEECTSRFDQAVSSVKGAKQVHEVGIPGQKESNLKVKFAYIPPSDQTTNLIVLSSGVHGVEGYVGSAIQRYFLESFIPKMDLRETGVLLIHSVNPYGMKHHRRVSEDNVDLNRNFEISADLFSTKNDGYAKLDAVLNPSVPASTGSYQKAKFLLKIAKRLLGDKMAVLRQAVLQGQYQFPKGIYYGGSKFEPQKALITPVVQEKAHGYSNVLFLDLHTGYGKKGVLHLFPSEIGRKLGKELEEILFSELKLEETSGSDFYDNYGDFSTYLAQVLARDGKRVYPLVLEYGTMNSQTTLGALESLRRVVNENQLHFSGARSASDRSQIEAEFLDAYFPKDAKWFDSILKETASKLPVIINRFSELRSPASHR